MTILEGLNILGFDDNCSNSAEESSANEEAYDSSDYFSANESSTSKKMAQYVVSQVHKAPEEVCEQSHMIDKKISNQQTQNRHN